MPPLDPFPLFVFGGCPFNGKLKEKFYKFTFINFIDDKSMDLYYNYINSLLIINK